MLVQWFMDTSLSSYHYIFSSIKKTNWLINKRMHVLLFDVFEYLLLRKTHILKTFWRSKYLRKRLWRNALAFVVVNVMTTPHTPDL